MKRSIKKLSLNKKAISNLHESVTGGARTTDPLTSTDPTKLTWCYHCPIDPIDPFDPISRNPFDTL